jgi:hypothetical protein
MVCTFLVFLNLFLHYLSFTMHKVTLYIACIYIPMTTKLSSMVIIENLVLWYASCLTIILLFFQGEQTTIDSINLGFDTGGNIYIYI